MKSFVRECFELENFNTGKQGGIQKMIRAFKTDTYQNNQTGFHTWQEYILLIPVKMLYFIYKKKSLYSRIFFKLGNPQDFSDTGNI